eukprot:RCo053139
MAEGPESSSSPPVRKPKRVGSEGNGSRVVLFQEDLASPKASSAEHGNRLPSVSEASRRKSVSPEGMKRRATFMVPDEGEVPKHTDGPPPADDGAAAARRKSMSPEGMKRRTTFMVPDEGEATKHADGPPAADDGPLAAFRRKSIALAAMQQKQKQQKILQSVEEGLGESAKAAEGVSAGSTEDGALAAFRRKSIALAAMQQKQKQQKILQSVEEGLLGESAKATEGTGAGAAEDGGLAAFRRKSVALVAIQQRRKTAVQLALDDGGSPKAAGGPFGGAAADKEPVRGTSVSFQPRPSSSSSRSPSLSPSLAASPASKGPRLGSLAPGSLRPNLVRSSSSSSPSKTGKPPSGRRPNPSPGPTPKARS